MKDSAEPASAPPAVADDAGNLGLRGAVRRRKVYRSTGQWLVGEFYQRMLLALPAWPLPGRNAVRPVRLRGEPSPVFVRLGTSDLPVVREILVLGEYRRVVDALSRPGAGPVRRVLDLGANIGMSVRLWQARFPGVEVVAVEPDADNLALARRNAIRPGDVIWVEGFVAADHRRVRLDRGGGMAWSFTMADGSDQNTDQDAGDDAGDDAREASTVCDLIARFAGDGPVDLLKCDVEGAEAEVFADCGPWIGRVRNLVVETHGDYTGDALLADVRRGLGGRDDFAVTTLAGDPSRPGTTVLFLEFGRSRGGGVAR